MLFRLSYGIDGGLSNSCIIICSEKVKSPILKFLTAAKGNL